jgi:hypothetical protein
MTTKEKLKMCPYCEGSITVDATECKYCGSSLIKGAKKARPYQTAESLASLYDPPYAPHRKSGQVGVPVANYLLGDEDDEDDDFEEEVKQEPPSQKEKVAKAQEGNYLGALLLLSIGGVLFTLAWLLFFFSDHGRLVLEWKSRYWPFYLLLSLPLLYKGWTKLNSLSEK